MKANQKNEIENMQIVRDVSNIANLLLEEQWTGLTHTQAVEMAIKIQRNRIFQQAFVTENPDYPSALEKIAIEMEEVKNLFDKINFENERFNEKNSNEE